MVTKMGFKAALGVMLVLHPLAFAKDVALDAKASEARFLVNRTVLSVENNIYTVADLEILLVFWNLLAKDPAPLTTDWKALQGTRIDPKLSLHENMQDWPEDVKTALFIAMVQAESQRLNLFVPREKELKEALEKVSRLSGAAEGLSERTKTYLYTLPEGRVEFYVDTVLRAITFARLRGDLDKNPGLLRVLWYWHVLPVEAR